MTRHTGRYQMIHLSSSAVIQPVDAQISAKTVKTQHIKQFSLPPDTSNLTYLDCGGFFFYLFKLVLGFSIVHLVMKIAPSFKQKCVITTPTSAS